MSQFGNAKNLPWGGQQLNPQLFNQLGGMNIAGQQFLPQAAAAMHQLNATQLGMAGMGLPGINVNAAAFTSQANQQALQGMQAVRPQQAQAQQQQQGPQKNQRAFVGVVTKMQDNYGFVDDDVFFQTTVVRGAMPRVGERVMVEANFNPNMPFKWNAFRIQLLATADAPQAANIAGAQQMGGNMGGNSAAGAQTSNRRPEDRWGPPTGGGGNNSTANNAEPMPSSRGVNDFARQMRERSPLPPRRRDRSPTTRRQSPPARRSPPPPRRRSPSPRRQSSVVSSSSNLKRDRTRSPTRERESSPPSKRRPRIAQPTQRFASSILLPKNALDTRIMTSYWLRKNMTSLYIPSDFFHGECMWHTAFPLYRTLNIGHGCSFHVMSKEVDPLCAPAVLDPPDLDYSYSAKVMLMANPHLAELYKRTLGLNEDETVNDSQCVPAQRAINFLVGVRGKSEVVSIGGPWSPSLDGPNPDTDPRTLIKTAIRTCRALTGVDLTPCTQWYKFVELRYRRIEKERNSAGGGVDGAPDATYGGRARVELVTIFLPDVWSLEPTAPEFESTQQRLKEQLDAKLHVIDKPCCVEVAPEKGDTAPVIDDDLCDPVPFPKDESLEEKMETEVEKKEATKWNKLDLKSMKVTELRCELSARNLDTRGVKAALSTRLAKSLKEEQSQEAAEKVLQEVEAQELPEGNVGNNEGTVGEPKVDPKQIIDDPKQIETIVTSGSGDEIVEKIDDDIEITKVKLPTKTKEELEAEEKERIKAAEKEEKEKKAKKEQLVKQYSMPANPGILVFPHKTAKGGKFECKVLSLHQLLDYRQEDNKEHSFEVAVFAEAFYEMMCRDAAFTVYKTLLAAPDKDYEEKMKKKKEEEETAKKIEEEAKKIAENKKVEDANAQQNGENKEITEAMDTENEEIKDVTPVSKESSVTKDSSPKKENKRSKSKEREEQKKLVTVVRTPDKLWAFTVFDQAREGRIPEKDCQEILLSLGLKLSRAQVQRIIRRVSVREHIEYKPYVETLLHKETREIKKQPITFPIPDDQILANGNCTLTTLGASVNNNKSGSTSESEAKSGLTVIYEGIIVDVAQIVAQLKKVENQQHKMILHNNAIDNELKTSNSKIALLEKKKGRLEEDVSKYKKRLNEAEKCLKTSVDDTALLKNALIEAKKMSDRIARTVEKVLPDKKKKKEEEKKEEKEAKTDKETKEGDIKTVEVKDDDFKEPEQPGPATGNTTGINTVENTPSTNSNVDKIENLDEEKA